MLKERVKELLLSTSLYYPLTNSYKENRNRFNQQKLFYSRLIGPDDVVFDIGANIGQRSQVFAAIASKVVALEPQPVCLRHLRSRFRFNNKVVIEPFAAGAEEGTATLHLSDSHTISSMSDKFINTVKDSVFKNNKWNHEITVRTATLDELINKHGLPSFIKIDVEGYESEVLKGLSKKAGGISFEFLPMMLDDVKTCADRIHSISADYMFNYTTGEELNFKLPKHVTYQEFCNTVLAKLSEAGNFGDIYAIAS